MSAWWKVVIGGVAGSGLGFLMYRFIGCRTGMCPLTANPWIAMLVWGLMGVMLASGK